MCTLQREECSLGSIVGSLALKVVSCSYTLLPLYLSGPFLSKKALLISREVTLIVPFCFVCFIYMFRHKDN